MCKVHILPTMANNLVSLDECIEIARKLIGNENFKVVGYKVSSYSEGYPGFLGDYFLLKIKFSDVRLRCKIASLRDKKKCLWGL